MEPFEGVGGKWRAKTFRKAAVTHKNFHYFFHFFFTRK